MTEKQERALQRIDQLIKDNPGKTCILHEGHATTYILLQGTMPPYNNNYNWQEVPRTTLKLWFENRIIYFKAYRQDATESSWIDISLR